MPAGRVLRPGRAAGLRGQGRDRVLGRGLARLHASLARLERKTSPFQAGTDIPRHEVHWTRPELVAQIGFQEWTPDGLLRHPRYLGLRDDKDPASVVRETPVQAGPGG